MAVQPRLKRNSIGNKEISFFTIAVSCAFGLLLWTAMASKLDARDARQGPASPLVSPYDFRSRPFEYDQNFSCVIELLGEDGDVSIAPSPWKMQTGDDARIRINMPGNITMFDCNGTISDHIHIVLEGPAVIAPVSLIREGRQSVAKIAVYDEGTYNVHVEIVLQCTRGDKVERVIRRVNEVPLLLQVSAGNNVGFPHKKCTDFHWKHGRWLECHKTPLLCVRTGWIWVPSDCYIPVMSADEIINQTPTWIVFAGSSIERGTFLSIVDYILGPRAANLTNSDFWKCWGWMDLTVGNMRISYIDFRVFYPMVLTGDSTYMMPMYLAQSMLALLGIGREGGTGPDVFHLEFPDWYSQQQHSQMLPPHDFAGIIRSWLGSAWAGKFIISVSKSFEVSSQRYDKPKLYDWSENHKDSGLDYVDETHMAAAALHDMENNLTQRHWSFHYHRRCNQGGMHSCSVVCDAAAQQILNFASRRHKSTRRPATEPATRTNSHRVTTTPMKFCLNCPRDLVPYTIKHWLQNENTACHSFVPDTM